MSREEILSIEQYCSAHNVTHKQRLAELNIPFWKFYRAKQRYRVCSMLFSPELLSRFIGIHTVPRMSCCFMENWSRSFTRKSELEMALNRSRTRQLGVTSMKRHTLSWTCVNTRNNPPVGGTQTQGHGRMLQGPSGHARKPMTNFGHIHGKACRSRTAVPEPQAD